jgi:hypothetical protein
MASKKSGWIVNPATTLLHNGKSYKGGSVIEDLTDEEIAKLPYGTLLPASSKEIRDRVTGENAAKIEGAKTKLEALKAELASLEAGESERIAAFERDSELAQMRIEQAQKEVHEAEQAAAKAQAEMDGGVEVAPAPKTPAMAAAEAAKEAAAKSAEGGKKK